ncbi:MAG: NUDIX domain-containing protein [Halolamina sp.]
MSGVEADQRELRIGAKALITDHGRVLLVKERHGDGSTFWTLPGGGVERGESFSECLRRELEEEIRCGATIGDTVGRYVYRHTSRPTTTVYAIFEATLRSEPEPNRAECILDYAWLEPTDLLSTTLDPVEHFIERSVAGTRGER